MFSSITAMGFFSGYAHLSQFLVTRGQTIQRGKPSA
jgi:murein DD-endopeptidase MepM/ murein hydrolase activator NlpD